MKKRITRLVTVASVTAAMMAATAAPALAVTPYDCRDTAYAVYYGEELDAQDLQLISQYPSLQACVQDTV
jgi:hypothetical protein